MALIHSNYTRGGARIPAPQNAGEVVAMRYTHLLTVAQQVTGNIIEIGVLPAYCRVIDMILDSDDLDTAGPAITLDVGLMTGSPGEALDAAGDARTMGAEFFAASVAGQAGVTGRMTLKGGFRVAPVAYDRSIGLKVLLEGTTPAEGTIGLTVLVGT